MSQPNVVGTWQPRIDSIPKAIGEARFVTDIYLPGMLHGRMLHSTVAHARILNVDVSRARRIPGVKAVITGKDVTFRYGRLVEDQTCLAVDVVRYVGEPVAAVAAVDEETAEEALSAIEIDYQPLPAVFEVEEALSPDAPLVHPDLGSYRTSPLIRPTPGTNICNTLKVRKGDVESGFRQSDMVFEHRFTTPAVQHCCLEPCGAVADAVSGGPVTVWAGTQGPHLLQDMLMQAFRLKRDRVRVIACHVGGGFGSKSPMHVEPLAVALSMQSGRPVRVVRNREEEFIDSVTRHPTVVTIKSGVTRDGRIIARQVRAIYDTGAYARTGPTVARNAGITASGPYDISHVSIDSLCVYTNKVPAAGMRGYGTPQLAWAYESHTDMIAQELGIDPVDFRLRNVLRDGAENANGERVKCVALSRCIEEAAKHIGWGQPTGTGVSASDDSARDGNPRDDCTRDGNKVRGKGIACVQKACAGPGASVVTVRLDKKGSVTILTSASELGQGLHTVLAQIVADELGLPSIDGISVMLPDPSYTPYDDITAASKATFHTGNAARAAARDVRNQLLAMASSRLSLPADQLETKGGRIWSKDGRVSMGFAEALGRIPEIVGTGTFFSGYVTPMDPETGQSECPVAFWMYGAQAVEVELDTETGQVGVVKVAAAHDVGQAINRLGCEQQIHGGVVLGIGQAVYEELLFNQGKVMNPSLLDYKVPTARDIPEISSIIVEDAPHDMGPFGAKGIGEPAAAPTAAAIANAVYDAIGVRITDLPVTAEKILSALRLERSGRKGLVHGNADSKTALTD